MRYKSAKPIYLSEGPLTCGLYTALVARCFNPRISQKCFGKIIKPWKEKEIGKQFPSTIWCFVHLCTFILDPILYNLQNIVCIFTMISLYVCSICVFPIKKQSNLLQKIHFSVNLQYLEFYRVDTRKERLNAQPSVLEWENVFLCGDITFSERVITSNEEINVNSFGSYGWLIKRNNRHKLTWSHNTFAHVLVTF